jgi:hypothetical protein
MRVGKTFGDYVANLFVFDHDRLMGHVARGEDSRRGIVAIYPKENRSVPITFSSGFYPWVGRPTRVADGILGVDSYGGWGNLLLAKFDGPLMVLHRPTKPTEAVDVTVDRSRSDTIVWSAVTHEGASTKWEIWQAPYTAKTEEFAPKLIARIPDITVDGLAANLGLALVIPAEREALLVRVSDGKGWKLPAPDGLRYAKTLWVDEKYVSLMVSSNMQGAYRADGILRIERSSLGEAMDISPPIQADGGAPPAAPTLRKQRERHVTR